MPWTIGQDMLLERVEKEKRLRVNNRNNHHTVVKALERRKLVRVFEQDNAKWFEITDDGIAFLKSKKRIRWRERHDAWSKQFWESLKTRWTSPTE